MNPEHRGVDRRAFLKAAVAIGGASALAACLDREDASVPEGVDDPTSLPERQHAWNDSLTRDDHGNVVPPRHHALLHLELDESPSDADREAVEAALRSLERAYEWSNEGLVFTLAYSPAYFDLFDASLPDSVDLPEPRALSDFEDPTLDTPDALLHLASDRAQVVLEAEEALRGNRDTANGEPMDAALTDAFSVADRRSGFIGDGLPADHQDTGSVPDSKPVPEDAPLYMGFESGFEKSQASEDRVTIESGPFADGTTEHVSHIDLNLVQWYEQDDRDSRVAQMFCPAHADSGAVEGTGENLGDSPQLDDCGDPVESGEEHGVVGHSQKLAETRVDDEPLLLRRDFDSTDGGNAGVHFLALQSSISDFEAVREAMNGDEISESTPVGQRQNNGIRQYLSVTHRGNYLVPPRSKRALPTPAGETA